MRILSQDKKITTEYKNAVGIKEVETPIKTKSLKKTKKTYTLEIKRKNNTKSRNYFLCLTDFCRVINHILELLIRKEKSSI